MKILNSYRRTRLRECRATKAQVRSAIKLWRGHGEPEEIRDCGDFIAFVYRWSFVGIERDGYAHS